MHSDVFSNEFGNGGDGDGTKESLKWLLIFVLEKTHADLIVAAIVFDYKGHDFHQIVQRKLVGNLHNLLLLVNKLVTL